MTAYGKPLRYSKTGAMRNPAGSWTRPQDRKRFGRLAGRLPNWYVYGLTMFMSLFSFYFGYWFFDRYRNVIVDVI